MAGQKFTLTFDAQMNVSQMKGALNQIQSSLNGLHLPQNITKNLQGTFDKLSKEIQDFEVAIGKDITGKADFKKLETQANKITNAFERLKIQVKDLTGLSGKDLERLFPEKISKNISNASNALKTYQGNIKAASQDVSKAQGEVDKLNQKIQDVSNKKALSTDEWKKLKDDISAAEAEVDKYKTAITDAQNKASEVEARTSNYKQSSIWRQAQKDIVTYTTALQNAENTLKGLTTQQANATTYAKQTKDLAELNNKLTEATNKLQQYQNILNNMSSASSGGGLRQLLDDIGRLTGLDMSKFSADTKGASDAIQTYLNRELQNLANNLRTAEGAVHGAGQPFRDLGNNMRDAGNALEQFNTQAREIDQLRSRIQYFFGLNNAIQLVKRTMREAYNTIKELDKAMTETAVVTDFSVGDMWAQLPDYTKRANELGVTTKAAYEAATLYYQQGLKTNEVMAISNETLKMARIAGLDAAVATDRMTNAIRGFNMEINEQNVQRIDDVYSRLAAISASNVDEISTAMTKVASLAHNANMEFETTAAFLAQIIETTRESAETAGTALKTVVARFSEVKKLVGEGELKGQDDEGELVDVNKVSQALRTAGIDLNKYFLGEVGLDDIFLELASKWENLTTLQQRYIATQAAGSRQQSRFIALMSDYARTQELVGEAYEANGASAKQFEKTQESLESKLARLKNAWNEFAMGILNSDLVKAGVDLLTSLLNGINALTSGFGTLNSGAGKFLNTFSKLMLLIGGLNLGKGLASGLFASIGGVLTGKPVGPGGFGSVMATSMLGGASSSGFIGNLAGKGTAGTLAAGFLNPFAGLGTVIGSGAGKAWASAQTLGNIWGGVTAGSTAAGLAGIATALGAIGAAVGVIVAGYKAWEKFTPEGQLKVATKLAQKAEENAAKAKEVAQSYKEVQDSYQNYSNAINESTSTTERDAAILSRNDYILSLIEKDATYAKYLQSAIDGNGQIVLTLDEEALASAAEKAAKAAVEANVDSYFANANQQDKQAAVYNKQAGRLGVRAENLELDYRDSSELRAEQTAKQVAAETARAAANNYARLGYQALFTESGLSDEIANSLASALGSIYGQTGRINNDNLTELQAWASSASAQRIIFTLAGDIGNTNLLGLDEDAMLEAIGIDETSDAFVEFSRLTGLGTKELKKFINNIAQSNRQVQESNRQRLQERFNQLGVSQDRQDTFFSNATPDFQQTVVDTLNYADSLISNGNYSNLIDILLNPATAEQDIREIQTFLNGINLDNPLNAFLKLQDGLESTSKHVQQLAQDILNSNTQIFNSGNLVRQALTEAYEDIGEDVAKLVEENGKITPKELIELADKSETLSDLLDANVASVKSLAKALEMIADGRMEFEDLNDTILDILDNMYTFDDLVNEVHDYIANFDEGIDYGEGIDFLVDKITELEELTDNFEFGNERTQKLWKAFFGGNYVDDWEKGEDWMRGRIQQMKQWLDNDAYGFFSDKNVMDQLGITMTGDHELEWNIEKYGTLNNLLEELTTNFGISEQAAKMFVEAFASHGDIDFYNQLQTLSLNSAIDAVKEQVNNGKTFWSDQDLQIIADQFGMQLDDLKTKLQEEVGQLNFYDADTPLFGKQFFDKFKEDLTLNGQEFDTWIQGFITEEEGKRKLNIEQLRNALSQMGYDATAQADLIQQISQSESLNGAEVELNNLQFTIASILGVEVDDPVVNEVIDQIKAAVNEKDPTVALDTIKAVLGETATLDANSLSAILSWLNTQLSGQSVDLTNLTANPTFAALTPEKKAAVLLAIASDIKDGDVDLDGLSATLTKLNISEETQQSILADLTTQLTPTEPIKVPIELQPNVTNIVQMGNTPIGDGEQTEVINVEANTQGYEAAVTAAAQTAATQSATFVEGELNGVDPSTLRANLENAINEAGISGVQLVGLTINGTHFWAYLDLVPQYPDINGSTISGATGGVVRSRASGGNQLTPGPALTGEEAPEIVWNKERGYAYITGQNGPEFRNLNPGDRVFNGAETRRILRNSFASGGVVASYARGRWNPIKDGNVIGSGKGKSSSGNDSGSDNSMDNPTVWENEMDWLYNLMEDIAELERVQTRLSEQHDRYLKDISKTGRDLYNTTKSQLDNLYTARENQAEALRRRRQEMDEQLGISGLSNYVWWNDNDQTIEIDWDAIEAIQDKDTYDEVKDLVSRAEKIQDEMDAAQDALWDIEGQIKELEQRYLQEFTQYQQRVYDAVVKTYQDSIDNLSNLNDTLNDTNSRILDSISKEIDLERQIRDNTDTENTIADMEARLAYLRRDTTSANEAEIRDLEKQLEDARENYSDTLIDQQLDRLSEANQQAAEQREQQIALMTAQLEYWQETGALWTEVAQLMEGGIDDNGTIIRGSELEQILRNADDWKAMSEQQREVWGNELITSTNQAGAYLLKISEGLDGISAGVWAMIPSSSVTSQKLQYATGGLNKATGWAWLDGTANEPEYVLNARQTDAFLRLSEILPSMFNGNSITNNNLGGNVYVELTMNVSNISSDYDVDRFMDRVKSNIYDAASYRNVNAVNFQR